MKVIFIVATIFVALIVIKYLVEIGAFVLAGILYGHRSKKYTFNMMKSAATEHSDASNGTTPDKTPAKASRGGVQARYC